MVISRNFNYSIIKLFRSKFIGFLAIVFSIFLFNPLNSFAATPSDLDIWLYFTDGTSTTCTDLNYCFTTNSQPLVNRVSIKTQSYSIIEGSKYDVYSSVKLWLLRDNLDIRNDFYIGNLAGTQWNNQSNISWNNLDSSEYDDFGGFHILNWGLVQNFTSSFSSSGITWDFYFNNPTRLSRIEVTRFELLNTGNTTADSINNMSNNIINNNNENTQNIINTENKNHEEAEESRKGIWNTIKELPSKFLDMLISLFIPDDFSFLHNLKDSLENKLGFIAEIPISILEFTLNLANASWERFDTISFPSIEFFGVSFWNTQEISLQPAIDIFEPYKYITDILCVILCCNTLLKWYQSFTDGGGK